MKKEIENINDKKIVFIGSGNMAEALIKGILAAKVSKQGKIVATDINEERLNYIKQETGVGTSLDITKEVESADVIILSVKPQVMRVVLDKIGKKISTNQLLISIAAGVLTSDIEKFIKKEVPVIRVMPNIPVLVRQGMCAICRGSYACFCDEQIAEKIFSSVGKVIKCREELMDAVTALSGSGPAYIFYILEILINVGQEMGLSQEISKILSKQTVLGAIELLEKTNLEPGDLCKKVTSPGGTTEKALEYFKNKHFANIFSGALKSAKKRAKQLSKQFNK